MLDESLAANEILSYQPFDCDVQIDTVINIEGKVKTAWTAYKKALSTLKTLLIQNHDGNRPITTHKRNLSYVANHIFRKSDLLFDYWTTTTLLTMTSAQVVETLPTTID